MKLVKIRPKFLHRYINYFYVLKSDDTDIPVSHHRHLPDGNIELMLNIGAPTSLANSKKELIQLPDAAVTGPFDKHSFSKYSGAIHQVGIFFKPEACSYILRDRGDLIRGAIVSADTVFHSEIVPMVERLQCISNPTEAAAILEAFFLPGFISHKEPQNFANVQRAVELIQAKKGNVTQQDLLKVVYLSERHLRRIFTEYTGLSPKMYARLIRVKNILRLMNNGKSLYDIAFELGYYDPAHLCNDFAEIAGLSPLLFHQQLNGIDHEFLKYHK